MPDWEPNWEDVRWSQAAAAEAAGALMRAAVELEGAASERGRAARVAMEQWLGPRRREFEERKRQSLGELYALAERCRRAAAEIGAASVRAREEQARRERDRAEWERERDRERAREAARARA